MRRVTIEGVEPEIDGGKYPAKRVVGEALTVKADVFTDGHDAIGGVLRYRADTEKDWHEAPLEPLVNDRFQASFTPRHLGFYSYRLVAWVDRFGTWLKDFRKRVAAGQESELPVQLLIGARLVEEAARRAKGEDRKRLKHWAQDLAADSDPLDRAALVEEPTLRRLMDDYPDRTSATKYAKELKVWVDPPKARFSAWYEMFPRSSWDGSGKHATFKDCEQRLEYIASLGFDVVYLPPIHPIGTTFRKGPNNTLSAGPKDPGSPWAIGSKRGGHTGIHSALGAAKDFRRFVKRAKEFGMDVALDIALQCSPDHPYVREHPEWFRRRPDGSIQYAENPPKKYQDIYPIEFESTEWNALWDELRDVFFYWIDLGIRIFRVDNPHTKPFRFWEWVINEIKQEHPDVILLAEAFTRPKVMYHLAKSGYTQSYTYFAWRNTKWELTEYLTELTQGEAQYFFRPNFWPNTPDILTEFLQTGGPPAFQIRLVLAATLAANYGIYGPAFELMEHIPRDPGSEEYLHSEKYEICMWDVDRQPNLRDFIARVNHIRRDNPALHTNETLRFHEIQHDELIWYSKVTPDKSNAVVVACNLNPFETRAAWAHLPIADLGLDADIPYQMHDLLSDARYLWRGEWNYVELNPYVCPAHVFRVRQRVRTEENFDYYD